MAKKKEKDTLPMMPFFVRDYISATRGFTLEQRGAYTDLLFFQWDLGILPEAIDDLARMLGASIEHFSRIWSAIASKFPLCRGGRRNPRLETERKKSQKLAAQASKKAKTAANARWNKDKAERRPTMPQALLEECPPSPSPSEDQNKTPQPPSKGGSGFAAITPILEGESEGSLDRDLIWSAGVPMFGDTQRGRNRLGGLVKRFGEDLVARKLGELLRMPTPPRDPANYLAAMLKPHERKFMA